MPTNQNAPETVAVASSSSKLTWESPDADDRTVSAIRDLKVGELIQISVSYADFEAELTTSHQELAPDDVQGYFDNPSALTFSFYRLPDSGEIFLIWTQLPGLMSAKRMRAQSRMRKGLAIIATEQGHGPIYVVKVPSHEGKISKVRLQAAIASDCIISGDPSTGAGLLCDRVWSRNNQNEHDPALK